MKHSVLTALSIIILLCCDLHIPAAATEITYNLSEAVSVAKEEQKNILAIFSIDGCPYCTNLIQDMQNDSDMKNFVVCYIDVSDDRRTRRQYSIRNFPSSLIFSYNNTHKELSRKVGYKNSIDFKEWLNQNK
jgi:thioredoxin-related protein